MKTKLRIIIAIFTLLPLAAFAQEYKFSKAFERIDLSVSGGTTGVGFELNTPVHKIINLRAGFTFMPKIKPVMSFNVEGRNAAGEITSFANMADIFEQVFGIKVDERVDMQGETSFYNFNVMADFFPFRNKNWYVTAGIYMGPNKIAHAYNKTEEMAALVSVAMYNNMYEKFMNYEPIYNDIYLEPELEAELRSRFESKGRLGIYVGNFKQPFLDEEGKPVLDEHGKPVVNPYMMEPDADAMVKVKMKTKTWLRPYAGFGYSGNVIKNNDKFKIGFECGLMYWGGVPRVLTHDGVDLTRDLTNIRGQVNDYVKTIEKFPIYPVLNLKLAYRLF